jgi:hypothetical protein
MIGTESPRSVTNLISRLDLLVPGIRLRERLHSLSPPSHQNIANFLGAEGKIRSTKFISVPFCNKILAGLLTPSVLNALRTSEIRCLSLTASINDQDGLGLNLAAPDIFHGLYMPFHPQPFSILASHHSL